MSWFRLFACGEDFPVILDNNVEIVGFYTTRYIEADTQSELDLPPGAQAVSAQVTGTVWKLLVKEGERVDAGKAVIMIESMKMEFPVDAPLTGTVRQIFCKQGGYVSAGQVLFVIQEEN